MMNKFLEVEWRFDQEVQEALFLFLTAVLSFSQLEPRGLPQNFSPACRLVYELLSSTPRDRRKYTPTFKYAYNTDGSYEAEHTSRYGKLLFLVRPQESKAEHCVIRYYALEQSSDNVVKLLEWFGEPSRIVRAYSGWELREELRIFPPGFQRKSQLHLPPRE